MKLQFSGHESFICKHFWLKKGYDFISNGGNFSDDSAVVDLGVGKNMVASISFWLKAFGIIDLSNNPTELGQYLFHSETGKDAFIESIGTVWLLQYSLVKTNKASLYSLFYNEFRRERHEFTKDQLSRFILKKGEENNKLNPATINNDIAVFLRSYLVANNQNVKTDVEDEFSNLLTDLEFLTRYHVENSDGRHTEWYRLQNNIRPELPYQIVLYTILDNSSYSKSIPFRELLIGHNSPGAAFALNEDGLYQKIEEIKRNIKGITYTETAGVRELQIKGNLNKEEVLNGYYNY